MKRAGPAGQLEEPLVEAVLEVPASAALPLADSDPPPPARTRTGVVAGNVAATMVAQIISWALAFLVTIYLPRYLGASAFGLLTLASTFGAILMSDLGTGTVLVKEIARDRSRVGELVSNALAMRVPFALLCAAIGMLAAYLLHYSLLTRELIAIGLSIMVLSQFSSVIGSALYGLEKIRKQNIAFVVDKVLSATIMIGLVVCRAPLWQFVAVGLFTGQISLCLNVYFFKDYLSALTRPSLCAIRSLLKSGLPYISTSIFNSIYIKIDPLLMSKMSSFAAIGWYSAAARLAGTCMFVPVNLCSAMLPTVTRIYHEDQPAFGSAMCRSFNLVLVAVVPFSAVLLLAPDKILAILHWPAAFRNAIPVLMVWGVALVLYYLSQVASMALNASDRQWTFSRVTGIAAAFSIPLTAVCIYLAQRYWANGAVGAIISDALAEVYITWAYIRALPRGIFSAGNFGVLLRAIIAALPTIAALHFLVHSRYDLIWVVLAALTYLPLCWTMRCLDPRDMQMFRQMLRRR